MSKHSNYVSMMCKWLRVANIEETVLNHFHELQVSMCCASLFVASRWQHFAVAGHLDM